MEEGTKAPQTFMRPSLQLEKLEGGKDVTEEEALDWWGRPATQKHGGPKTTFFILANQGLWNVANLAVATNLVLYFRQVLQMSNAAAANSVTNWFGTMWLLTLLGGFLGDSYWGRFWTCVVFQVIHIVGLILLGISVTLDALKPTVCGPGTGSVLASCPKPSPIKMNVFFVAIYIIALGSGGYLPAFQALGADQFNSEKHKTTFFGWLFFFTNVGSVLANTVFVYVENEGKWALGYWLATGVGTIAFFLFGLGVPTYRQFRPGGNPFTRTAQVVVAMARKWHVEVPNDASQLHEVAEKELVRQGSRKMPHTPRFRFFDKAATRVSQEAGDPWRLCNITQVEELKCLCRMMPIWLCAIPFSAVFSQINTLFVEQAAAMDTSLGSFHIPPASMSVVNVASIFVFTVIYPLAVVPVARAVTGRREGLSQLERLGVGQVGTAVAMAAAALVEAKRLRLAAVGRQLSVFWLAPQQVILGASQVFAVVGAMDFFYTQAPHAMRGMVSALSLANLAIGSYASSVLVSLTMRFTTTGGRPGWIPANLNQGHVDYFYWLLLCITLLNTVVFSIGAWWFNHTAPPRDATPSVSGIVHPSSPST